MLPSSSSSSYLKIKKLVADHEDNDYYTEDEDEDEDEDEEEEENMKRQNCSSQVKIAAANKKKKRSNLGEGGSGGNEVIWCVVEKCEVDLRDCNKKYHQRHRVCELHAKSPSVMVHGLMQRFCQQCTRFHELSEFDQTKRSCRRRLAGHNERRRKSSLESCKDGRSQI